MKEKRFKKHDVRRWRVMLVRLLVLCMLLPCMHIQAFAASQPISNGWYVIRSGNNSNKVLDISNWNMNNGCQLEIYDKNGGTNQIFYLQYVKTAWNFRWLSRTPYYTIRCLHSGKYIHTYDGRVQNTKAHQWEGCNNDNALWGVKSAGNGQYYFMNKASGACLDNSGGRTNNGNKVITYPQNSSPAQKWGLSYVSASRPGFSGQIKNHSKPSGNYTTSQSTKASGNIVSNYPITRVRILISNTGTGKTYEKNLYPNYISCSFSYTLDMSKIPAGKYSYKLYLWNIWNSSVWTNTWYFNVAQGDVYKNGGVPKYPDSRAKEVIPGITNSSNNRNRKSYNSVIDQFKVTTTWRYQRTTSSTYCNIFAWDVMSAMNVQLPHWTDSNRHKPVKPFTKNANEQRANDVYRWLAKYGSEYGWYSVNASVAQSRANNGYPTIAIWKNPDDNKSGHVMVVRPEAGNYVFKNGRGPVIAQAGASNYNYTYVKDRMGNKSVMYYTHK